MIHKGINITIEPDVLTQELLAPGDRVSGLIHVAVLRDTMVKTLTVASVGFELTYNRRGLSASHPIRSLATLTHIPPNIRNVRVFYARRTIVMENSLLTCGAHTYAFKTRLPVAGLEASFDTGTVGVYYAISASVCLPGGSTISEECTFNVGNTVYVNPVPVMQTESHNGVSLTASAVVHDDDRRIQVRTGATEEHHSAAHPKKVHTKFKRQIHLNPDEEYDSTIDSSVASLDMRETKETWLRIAEPNRPLVPTVNNPNGLFRINYNVQCRVNFSRRHFRHKPAATLVMPVQMHDERRASHVHGIFNNEGIPVITQELPDVSENEDDAY